MLFLLKKKHYIDNIKISVPMNKISTSFYLVTFMPFSPERAMATHSSVLAWRIPGTGEPGGLPSLESHRVGHD